MGVEDGGCIEGRGRRGDDEQYVYKGSMDDENTWVGFDGIFWGRGSYRLIPILIYVSSFDDE